MWCGPMVWYSFNIAAMAQDTQNEHANPTRNSTWVEVRPVEMSRPRSAAAAASQTNVTVQLYETIGRGVAIELEIADLADAYRSARAEAYRQPETSLGHNQLDTIFLTILDQRSRAATQIYTDAERAAASLGMKSEERDSERRELDALLSATERDRSLRDTVCVVDRSRCPEEHSVEDALRAEIAALDALVRSQPEGADAWQLERLARLLRARAMLRHAALRHEVESEALGFAAQELNRSILRSIGR